MNTQNTIRIVEIIYLYFYKNKDNYQPENLNFYLKTKFVPKK